MSGLWLALRFFVAATAFSTPLVTASERFMFDVWRVEDGLPQNSVRAVLETRDGYLWLATNDGLARFDGVRFVVFKRGDAPGLTTSLFTSLLEGSDGSLWIGTADSGVIKLKDGVFRSFKKSDGLPDNQIRGMRITPAGSLLVDTPMGPAMQNGDRFAPLSGAFGFPSSGGVWFQEGDTLRRDGRQLDLNGFEDRQIKKVLEDSQGGVWALLLSHTILHWSNGTRTVYEPSLPPHCDLMSAAEDSDHRIWFGFNMGRIFTFHDGQLSEPALNPDFGSWIVWDFYRDRDSGLWVATENGLFRLRPPVISNLSVQDGLSTLGVSSILRDRRGRTWIAGVPGLTIFENGRARPYNPTDLQDPGWVTTLYEDHNGDIWLATVGGKVLHEHNGEMQRIRAADYGVKNSGTNAFLQDHTGTMWFGTRTGLVKFTSPPRVFTVQDGLPSHDVRALLEDSSGTLWIGGSSGLTALRNGKFQTFQSKDGFPDAQVETLYLDRDGTLWIGTSDRGLVRYAQGCFTVFTTQEGLFDNRVSQLVEDDAGDFWIGCTRGVYRISRKQLNDHAASHTAGLTSIAYGTRDGMLSAECTTRQPGVAKDPDGRLWFSTHGGVAIIDPKRVARSATPPPVFIEQSLIDQKPVRLDGGLRLAPAQKTFELQYTAASFARPEQVRFKYKLDGLDTNWIDAGSRRSAYYSHVPPGHYVFRVIAANADGVWNHTGASLPVVVLPPFYRTLWFVALMIVSLAAALLMLHRRRIVALEKARMISERFSRGLIESQEEERKRIAGELHDSLGQDLLVIKNWAMLGAVSSENAANARNRFDEISAMASHAITEVRQIAHNLRPHQLDELGLTQAIRSIATNAAVSSDTVFEAEIDPVDGLFSKEAEINLYRIVQESVNNVIKHSGASRARIELRQRNNEVQLTVQDNGQGFAAASKAGFGLKGMVERGRIIGSKPVIESVPGKGTVVTFTVPLNGDHG